MPTFVLRNGELVEKHLAEPLDGTPLARGPNVISDTMEPIRSMADGRMYDSKSRYRADLKARGCFEIGNERIERRPVAAPPVRNDLRRVFHQLSSR